MGNYAFRVQTGFLISSIFATGRVRTHKAYKKNRERKRVRCLGRQLLSKRVELSIVQEKECYISIPEVPTIGFEDRLRSRVVESSAAGIVCTRASVLTDLRQKIC